MKLEGKTTRAYKVDCAAVFTGQHKGKLIFLSRGDMSAPRTRRRSSSTPGRHRRRAADGHLRRDVEALPALDDDDHGLQPLRRARGLPPHVHRDQTAARRPRGGAAAAAAGRRRRAIEQVRRVGHRRRLARGEARGPLDGGDGAAINPTTRCASCPARSSARRRRSPSRARARRCRCSSCRSSSANTPRRPLRRRQRRQFSYELRGSSSLPPPLETLAFASETASSGTKELTLPFRNPMVERQRPSSSSARSKRRALGQIWGKEPLTKGGLAHLQYGSQLFGAAGMDLVDNERRGGRTNGRATTAAGSIVGSVYRVGRQHAAHRRPRHRRPAAAAAAARPQTASADANKLQLRFVPGEPGTYTGDAPHVAARRARLRAQRRVRRAGRLRVARLHDARADAAQAGGPHRQQLGRRLVRLGGAARRGLLRPAVGQDRRQVDGLLPARVRARLDLRGERRAHADQRRDGRQVQLHAQGRRRGAARGGQRDRGVPRARGDAARLPGLQRVRIGRGVRAVGRVGPAPRHRPADDRRRRAPQGRRRGRARYVPPSTSTCSRRLLSSVA